MDLHTLAIIAAGLLLYSLVSGRLIGTPVTAPIVFIALGFMVSPAVLGVGAIDIEHAAIEMIAEITLVLVLFTDAARINFSRLKKDHNLPFRMLSMGLPLTMIAGTGVAVLLFPQFSIWEAALLAALLAPTDAALGQAVVSAKVVPLRIRMAINVESGLNDGIALPAVLLLAFIAAVDHGMVSASEWVTFGLLQVTLGPLTGIVIGFAGARLIDLAIERGWVDSSFQGIAILALAILAFTVSDLIGGNGFIAAFVGGMVFGNTIRNECDFLFEFMETEGQLLMLITFMIFGATLLPEGIEHFQPIYLLYAILSLTVIRMLPIGLSLIGAKLHLSTILFLGWFGPRGLASILFVLLIVEETMLAGHRELLSITVITVALSALLHGLSAAPFAQRYGRIAASMPGCKENREVTPIPLRDGMPAVQNSNAGLQPNE